MEVSQDGSQSKLRIWSPEEDMALVESLITLKLEQRFMAENGFKAGYVNAVHEMMILKLPGTTLKATPPVSSRIKRLKQSWQVAYDMVYGTNTSGFGWNPETKCITADPPVWDEYVKSHPKAAKFRTKPFPYFDELSNVWSKDRAVGEEGINPDTMEAEVNLEQESLTESPPPGHIEVEMSQTQGHPHLHTRDAPSNGRRKRKLNHSEIMAEALRDSVSSLENTIVSAFEKIGSQMSGQEKQAELKAKGDQLYDDLLAVEGITSKERNAAYVKILNSEQLLMHFQKIPPLCKAECVLDWLYP